MPHDTTERALRQHYFIAFAGRDAFAFSFSTMKKQALEAGNCISFLASLYDHTRPSPSSPRHRRYARRAASRFDYDDGWK